MDNAHQKTVWLAFVALRLFLMLPISSGFTDGQHGYVRHVSSEFTCINESIQILLFSPLATMLVSPLTTLLVHLMPFFFSDFLLCAVYAINSLYVALGSPSLPGWVASGGDPCAENWQGVQCTGVNITEMYGCLLKVLSYWS